MTTQEQRTGARLKVVQPGAGDQGGLAPGVGVIFKIDGADSGGALSIVEHTFEVGALVPPHVQSLTVTPGGKAMVSSRNRPMLNMWVGGSRNTTSPRSSSWVR